MIKNANFKTTAQKADLKAVNQRDVYQVIHLNYIGCDSTLAAQLLHFKNFLWTACMYGKNKGQIRGIQKIVCKKCSVLINKNTYIQEKQVKSKSIHVCNHGRHTDQGKSIHELITLLCIEYIQHHCKNELLLCFIFRFIITPPFYQAVSGIPFFCCPFTFCTFFLPCSPSLILKMNYYEQKYYYEQKLSSLIQESFRFFAAWRKILFTRIQPGKGIFQLWAGNVKLQ